MSATSQICTNILSGRKLQTNMNCNGLAIGLRPHHQTAGPTKARESLLYNSFKIPIINGMGTWVDEHYWMYAKHVFCQVRTLDRTDRRTASWIRFWRCGTADKFCRLSTATDICGRASSCSGSNPHTIHELGEWREVEMKTKKQMKGLAVW
jgi:hypothetical protein